MGCLLISRGINVPETPRPPHGKSMAIDEEQTHIQPFREKERVSTEDHLQAQLGQPVSGHGAFLDEDDRMIDINKIKRLLEMQQSERQAMEALCADVNLREPAYFPHLKGMIQSDDGYSRAGGDTLLAAESIEPFAHRAARRHSLPPLSKQFITKRLGVAPQYIIGKGRYHPGSSTNMQPYSTHMFCQSYPCVNAHPLFNPYGHSYPLMNSNVCESGRFDRHLLPNFSSVGMPNVIGPKNPNFSANIPMSTRSSSQTSSHSIGLVMGRKPEEEDCAPQRQIENDSGSQLASAQYDSGASLYGQMADAFEKPGISKDLRACSYPGERFCKQWIDPFEVDNSTRGFHNQDEVPGNDHRSVKSTETNSSKYGEMPTNLDSRNQLSRMKTEPIKSTDAFGVGICMSKVLEEVMSDATDSSTSIRIGIEYDSKVERADEDSWENLIKGVSVSSSSNSLELVKSAIATNIDPIHKQRSDGKDN